MVPLCANNTVLPMRLCYVTTIVDNGTKYGLLVLETQKFVRCAQVSTSAGFLDTANGTARAIIIKIAAVRLE